MSRPLVLLASALSFGTFLGFYSPLNSKAKGLLLLAAALLSLAGFLRRKMPRRAFVLLCLALCLIGFWRAGSVAFQSTQIIPPVKDQETFLCTGKVMGEPVQKVTGAQFDFKLESCKRGRAGDPFTARGLVRIRARKLPSELCRGDRAELPVRFQMPRSFKNPGSFSYRHYLLVHGIGAVGRAEGPVVLKEDPSWSLVRWLAGLKHRIGRQIEESVQGKPQAILQVLALGEREGISTELRESFSRAGIAHLLAISGLHVGYVAFCIALLVRLIFSRFSSLLLRIPLPKLCAVITLPALWCFVLFTGAALSSVRAAIMLSVYLAGIIFGLRQDLATTIAMAVMLILLTFPLSLFDVSFQLSFAAVVGIALISRPLGEWLKRDVSEKGFLGRSWRWMMALVVMSAAATVATAPILAFHFHLVTVVGLFANLVAVPLVGFLLEPLLLIATNCSVAMPSWSHALWMASGWLAQLLIEIAQFFSWSGSPFVWRVAPDAFEVLLSYSVIAVLLLWRRFPKRRIAAISLTALICLDLCWLRGLPFMTRDLVVTFFDVGQGDASFVQFPNGRTLLIDGGGLRGSSIDIGESVLLPALLRLGARRLDAMLLTHPHHDHYGGLGSVARYFRPKQIWTNGLQAPKAEEKEWKHFQEELKQADVEIIPVVGTELKIPYGDVLLHILPRVHEKGDGLNDTSLIARMTYGEHKLLLMGDLEAPGERKLLSQGPELAADVLKIGHHGSDDASHSAFLDAVRPQVAVCSVGEGNRYRLPSEKVLQRLKALGAKIFRTDRDGAVTIRSDGRTLRTATYVDAQ